MAKILIYLLCAQKTKAPGSDGAPGCSLLTYGLPARYNPCLGNNHRTLLSYYQQQCVPRPRMVVHAFPASTRKAEAGRSLWVQGLSGIHCEPRPAKSLQWDPISKRKKKKDLGIHPIHGHLLMPRSSCWQEPIKMSHERLCQSLIDTEVDACSQPSDGAQRPQWKS